MGFVDEIQAQIHCIVAVLADLLRECVVDKNLDIIKLIRIIVILKERIPKVSNKSLLATLSIVMKLRMKYKPSQK